MSITEVFDLANRLPSVVRDGAFLGELGDDGPERILDIAPTRIKLSDDVVGVIHDLMGRQMCDAHLIHLRVADLAVALDVCEGVPAPVGHLAVLCDGGSDLALVAK